MRRNPEPSRDHARTSRRAIPALALAVLSVSGCLGGSQTAKTGGEANQVSGTLGIVYAINVSRPVGGTIRSEDGKINCGPVGSSANLCGPASILWSSAATLTATPDPDRRFGGWAGDCFGPGFCTLDTTQSGADKWVAAVFPPKASLPGVYFIVSVARPAGGTIRGSNGLIVCGTEGDICGPALYPWGQKVYLTATPAAGNSSIGWTGDCTGIGSCLLSAGPEASDKSVGFTFSDAAGNPIPGIDPNPPSFTTGVRVSIQPPTAYLSTGDSTSLVAVVTGTVSPDVTWTVTEAGGGTVDANGRYVAPATAGTFHVVAASAADPNRTATAVVTVSASSPPPQPPTPAGSCDGEPMRTTGTTYYVCDCASGSQPGCTAGNDSYAGTNPSTPWRSWSKAINQFNTMAAGSTVAFCRGGAWTGLTSVISEVRNQNCRADSASRPPRAGDVNTCDMRDYTPSWGGTNRPVLAFAPNQSFMTMGWYEDNNGGWAASNVTGVRVLNLDLVAANDGTSGAFYLWGRVQNLEVCGNTIRDGWAHAYSGVTTLTIKYVNFHHNRITNNPFGIGQIQGASCIQDCWFDSNYMDLNGGGVNRDHSIYAGSSPYGDSNWPTSLVGTNPRICQGAAGVTACYAVAKGTRITNNEIRRSAWGTGGSGCNASAIVIHTPHDDLLIENNLIYEPPGTATDGCYGIDQTAGIDMPGAWNRTVIRRNQIYNVGGNGITIGNCKDCVIEDNLVVGGSQGVQYPNPGNRCTSVAFLPTAYYNCSGNVDDSGGIVRNNTLYNAGEIGINGSSQGSGWLATNNAVCGSGAGLTAGTGTTSDHNLVNSSCTGWFQSPGTNPATASFKPGAPLSDTGGSVSEGTSYISVQPWSATDTGLAPAGTPNIGAVR